MELDDDLAGLPRDAAESTLRVRVNMRRAADEAAERFALAELVGLPVDEAKRRVEAAGGYFQTDAEPIATIFDFNRVIASTDGGRVTDAHAG